MRKRGTHFHYRDRLRIEYLFNSGASYGKIATELNASKSSVYAEIHKGLYSHVDSLWKEHTRYSADIAQQYAKEAATAKGAPIKLGHHYTYARKVAERIKNGESPDSITGQLRLQGKWTVSTNTLYDYIEKGYIPDISNQDLIVKQHKKKEKAVKRPARRPAGKSIEDRPEYIAERSTFGHWEMDSVIGKAKGQHESLLVLTERKSRYEIIIHSANKTAQATIDCLNQIFGNFKPGTFQTITVDNGSEFSNSFGMEHTEDGMLRTEVYYCHPFCSCERGSNENQNRLVRRFFPKGQTIAPVTNEQVETAESWINDYPRKILGYYTPKQLFDEWQQSL